MSISIWAASEDLQPAHGSSPVAFWYLVLCDPIQHHNNARHRRRATVRLLMSCHWLHHFSPEDILIWRVRKKSLSVFFYKVIELHNFRQRVKALHPAKSLGEMQTFSLFSRGRFIDLWYFFMESRCLSLELCVCFIGGVSNDFSSLLIVWLWPLFCCELTAAL